MIFFKKYKSDMARERGPCRAALGPGAWSLPGLELEAWTVGTGAWSLPSLGPEAWGLGPQAWG